LSALLVKLLDAGDELSVQIHPRDDYVGLAPDEAGKPESWYVLDASPGAGVYLGLRPGTTPEVMAECLRADDQSVATLLNFIPLAAGDFILVEAGMPHAIGKGITVIEPQVVLPDARCDLPVLDWNRRYDAAGQLDPAGSKRLLQLEHALAVTDWDLADTTSPQARATILTQLGRHRRQARRGCRCSAVQTMRCCIQHACRWPD
jgi:mannose-6-phosphate isomerase